MSKRQSIAGLPGESLAKKLRLDTTAHTAQSSSIDPAHSALVTAHSTDVDDDDDDNDHENTTAYTESLRSNDTPATTAVSTPRPKFPSDLKTLPCTWPGCPKSFNRPARLRDHLNSHTNSRPFKCTYDDCDKDYIEDKHLKQHIKAVHTHERKHVCQHEGCDKSFVTGTRLKRHQAVHDGAERFRCKACGQSFRKRETLHKHVRKDHEGKPPHECPEPGCQEAFESKGSLSRHREREHGELRYWCGDCGLRRGHDGAEHRMGFTTEALLQAHMRLAHQNCMFCDYRSASQWELENHMEMYHSGKTTDERKKDVCPYQDCGKRFTRTANLNAHIRTVHEGKRFVCGLVALPHLAAEGWSDAAGCGDSFSCKGRLEDHVRYIHLGHERPKVSRALPPRPQDILDELTGASQHVAPVLMGDGTSDPAAFLAGTTSSGYDDMFGLEDEGGAWPNPMLEEDIFAAQMDYEPLHDDWEEDEANIMLLAHDVSQTERVVDPSL